VAYIANQDYSARLIGELSANAEASEQPSPRRRRVNSGLEVFMDANLVGRDPEIMSGALCFTGTRVPVKNLFDYLEGSSSLEEFLEDFPSISRERAVAVLEAARERLAADAPAA
jgi:uncharacterized protein (DUF433 family)